ncbi:MAG TPA: ribbon-helix-helix protein, CopG family [Ktedonobacteraceae bacterium]|nr:ribbon-helix-helix protein, CopG family [Ktedonobacteraceae bacterium]
MANEATESNMGAVHSRSKGRPKKFPEAAKTGYLGFRLPEEEIEAIETAAIAAGESVSEYVRKAIEFRMEGRLPLTSSPSLFYEIPPTKIIDNKTSLSEGHTLTIPFPPVSKDLTSD